MTSAATPNTTLTRNDMFTQVVSAIKYMREKIKTDPDNAAQHRRELDRLQRLHDELHWFKTEY